MPPLQTSANHRQRFIHLSLVGMALFQDDSLKHESLCSSYSCCLPDTHSNWKLPKASGHSRTRLSPYSTEHAFLNSDKPAQTGFTLVMMPSQQQAFAPHISPHNPLPPLDKAPPNISSALPWWGYLYLRSSFHRSTSLLKQKAFKLINTVPTTLYPQWVEAVHWHSHLVKDLPKWFHF